MNSYFIPILLLKTLNMSRDIDIDTEKRVLLIYKLTFTDDLLTNEERDIELPIYPNDITGERHLKRDWNIIPPTVLIYPNIRRIEELVIKSLYEFCCRFTNSLLFSGITLIDNNPIIEVNETYTLINRKYEIDITEYKIILRRNSEIILEEPKWICSTSFYFIMNRVYNKIKQMKLLPMFTHIKILGDKVDEMRLIVDKLKEIYHNIYSDNNETQW